jgi:signal transduction histidine kinase
MAEEPRRVLLLHSFGRDFAPFNDLSSRFREELARRSPHPLDVYDASLETARFRDADDEKPFVDYLRALFAGRKLDLIATFGSPAAFFVQRYRQTLFPGIPLLILGVEQRELKDFNFSEIDTSVAAAIDFPSLLDNIVRVLPETANVAVALGDSPFEKRWAAELRRDFQPFDDKLQFIWFNQFSFDEVLRRAAELPPNSAILYLLFAVDAAGVPYEQDGALAGLHQEANAPIFGFADNTFGRGIVGGPLVSNRDHAKRASDVAVRILGGESPGHIKIAPLGTRAPLFDWRELRRWNISEQRLPAGSEVRFRPPGIWEEYRAEVTIALIAVLLQAAMITGLLFERHRRRQAEAQARSRLLEAVHLNRTATVSAISASIVHEVNQPLATIVANASAGLRWLSRETPDLNETRAVLDSIVAAGHRVSELIGNVRSMFKKEAEKREFVDVNKLIRETLTFARGELENRRVVTHTQLSAGLPNISADRIQLQQVLLNLVMNAIEAMSALGDRQRVLQVRSQMNDVKSVLPSKTRAPGSIQRTSSAYSSRSLRPSPMAWGWALRYADQSSNPMGGACPHVLLFLMARFLQLYWRLQICLASMGRPPSRLPDCRAFAVLRVAPTDIAAL